VSDARLIEEFSPRTLEELLRALGIYLQDVVVAVSGGADSAALLHAMRALSKIAPAGNGESCLRVRAVHVHHGLKASAELADAAVAIASECATALTVLHVVVPTTSNVEAAARTVRYAALKQDLRSAEVLLLAHHCEDQAETVLLQLLRGAGLQGLGAMPALGTFGNGRLARPLLGVSRAALRSYAKEHALPFIEDPMNADLRFERAYVRGEVWPVLQKRWPKAALTLNRAAAHLAEGQHLLDETSAALVLQLEQQGGLLVSGLLALSGPRRAAVLRYWLRSLSLPLPSTALLARVTGELLQVDRTATPRLTWPGADVRVYDGCVYAFAPLPEPLLAGVVLPAEDGQCALGALGELTVRYRRGEGLRLADLGIGHAMPRAGGERFEVRAGLTRPLKDVLREARLPPWVRARALLLAATGSARRVGAVVLPHITWVSPRSAAGPLEMGVSVSWQGAPAALLHGDPAHKPGSLTQRF
jgi:tRNA(Ile)-lysidine synthase